MMSKAAKIWVVSLVLAIGIFLALAIGFLSPATAVTEWKIKESLGLDTLAFIGVLSGDRMAEEIYQNEVDDFRSRLSDEGLAALKALDDMIRVEMKSLVGPVLAAYYSTGPTDTLDDLLATANDPERVRSVFLVSPSDKVHWKFFHATLPHVKIVVSDLRRVGFEEYWKTEVLPKIEGKKPSFVDAVVKYDLIPEQERLLGYDLESSIEIVVLNYNKPYGISISGQRFITHHEWEADVQLRTATHEILHSPFDIDDQEIQSLFKPLENDKWMQNVVNDHDPKFGYNTFLDGIVQEDSTKALDQIVSERLGFAIDPGKRFAESDEGMHMLAAALYHALIEDGFAENGGVYANWLKNALRRGLLTPEEVRRRAAEVAGQKAVDKWDY
jgi:hypothetical protein